MSIGERGGRAIFNFEMFKIDKRIVNCNYNACVSINNNLINFEIC